MSKKSLVLSILTICIVSFILVGCGKLDRLEATLTGYSTMCINGVTYIQFSSGGTVMVDINGKPVGCVK